VRNRQGHGTGIAKQDLGIGAHIDDEDKILGSVWLLRQRDGGGICAYMAGDAGQDVGARSGIDSGQAEIGRGELERSGCRQREWRLAEFDRVDTEKQVVHHRIADEDRLDDLACARSWPRPPMFARDRSSAERTAFVISVAPPGFIMA
jgi:hypothetical protein